MEKYGVELILDLHGCDNSTFTRESISEYFETLCKLIDMKREALHFWDDVGVPEDYEYGNGQSQSHRAIGDGACCDFGLDFGCFWFLFRECH